MQSLMHLQLSINTGADGSLPPRCRAAADEDELARLVKADTAASGAAPALALVLTRKKRIRPESDRHDHFPDTTSDTCCPANCALLL